MVVVVLAVVVTYNSSSSIIVLTIIVASINHHSSSSSRYYQCSGGAAAGWYTKLPYVVPVGVVGTISALQGQQQDGILSYHSTLHGVSYRSSRYRLGYQW